MKKLILLLGLAIAASACKPTCQGENEPPAPVDKPVWERYTHAQLLKFKGAIKEVHGYLEEDGERYEQFAARFDEAGRCTYYNGTGIDPDAAAYGFGVESAWYDYRYDVSGRMIEVVRNEVGGDPLTYRITYGTHDSYVAVPFPLGDIEPFMLKGVTRIEAEGYLLTCDGETARVEAVTSGWLASTTIEKWTIRGGMPVDVERTILRGDEEIARGRTLYTYEKKWLTEQHSAISGQESSQLENVFYSAEWPCSPTERILIYGLAPEDRAIVEYRYGENGLITGVAVSGVESDEVEYPFVQWYNAYDTQGNWTSSTKQIEGEDQILTRVTEYYR